MFLFLNRPGVAITKTAERTRSLLGNEMTHKLESLHKGAIKTGLVTTADLQNAYLKSSIGVPNTSWYIFGILSFILITTPIFYETFTFLIGVRCFLPNNYLVWEATRPISDCRFCKGVNSPLILENMTREEFIPFAYSSRPIVIKNAVLHWPAKKTLNYHFLKELYNRFPKSLEDNCEFLQLQSDLKSLKDVFNMPPERVNMSGRFRPWYVGWSICNPFILQELRKLYPRPHFLPVDAEIPNTDYIYLGYQQGVLLNLDYLSRLMWQAQLHGNKSWILAPTPECDHVCQSFSFYVEPGDAVLVDTRVWYHGITHLKSDFSVTIQSEYG